jgi:hypothetical protein
MRSLRLFAEALACPFIDPQSLNWPEPVDHNHGSTRLAERLMAYGASEQAADWWRQAWHGSSCWLVGLHDHATKLLKPGGRAWRLKPDMAQPGREILRWRAVSQRLPAGLLLAAAADGEPPAWQVQVLDDVLVPRGPLAHLHLHGNAVSHFEVLWTDQMTRRRGGSGPEHYGEHWPHLRARARVLRLVLARWVEARCGMEQATHHLFGDQQALVERALASLPALGGLSLDEEADLDNLTERLGGFERLHPTSLEEIWGNDLLSIWYRGPWPEGAWLSRVLRRARLEQGEDGQRARRLLLVYLRIKACLFAWLGVDPAVRGLGAFTRIFDRANGHTKPLSGVLPEQAGLDPVLRPDALELRTSPKGILEWLKEAPSEKLETALVAHFIRTDASGRPPVERICHFLSQANGLVERLSVDPGVQWRLRGLDLAGDERRGPLWILVPALRRVLELAEKNALRHHVPPLRTTFHVGEDFGHLLSGLRAVDEPLAWGLTGRGDRLGHALALGLEVGPWCRRHPRVSVRRVDRLLDLGWALHQIQRLPRLSQAEKGAWLMGLRQELFNLLPTGLSPGDAPRLFERLGDPVWLSTLEDRVSEPEANLFGLWKRWSQGEPEIVKQLETPIEVETSQDQGLMEVLQRAIAHDLSTLQVVVELNPTSNLCIGGLEQLVDQPLFRMRPWDKDKTPFGMPVTISTDDPLQLATCLSDEYAYAWAGLVVGAEVPPIEANAWLTRVAEDGWRGRFTRSGR